ncbi:MAG: thermonuclease family protein [Parvibaculum sp.]
MHQEPTSKSSEKPHRRPARPEARLFQIIATITLLASLSGFQAASRGTEALQTTDRALPGRFACQVAYVNDGDTLRCKDGTRIRLHAVAAREFDETCSPGHPCPTASAAAAKAELERLVTGSTISCRRVGRSYNRVTAICWTPRNVEVNCAMIRSGTTVVWERFNRQEPICAARPL